MYGRIMSSMSAVWHLYGYQDYPASEPPVCAFKICTGAQLKDFINRCKVTDLQIYYSQQESLKDLKYTEFSAKYNTSKTPPQFYPNKPETENDVLLDWHYFKIYIYFAEEAAIQYIYVPVRQVKRCIHIKMVYQTSGEIYYLRLILLKRPVLNDEDSCTLTAVHGGGKPIIFLMYQQSAIAHGYVESAVDAQLTFDDMCRTGTAAQCRSYFVILTLHGYATMQYLKFLRKSTLCIKIISFFNIKR
jgi:hypothetical protein